LVPVPLVFDSWFENNFETILYFRKPATFAASLKSLVIFNGRAGYIKKFIPPHFLYTIIW
jgi:hypothetical protein